MVKEKKIQVRKIETEEIQRQCNNCKFFTKITDTIGICNYKNKLVLPCFNCLVWEHGEPKTATIDDIAYLYEWTKLELEAMKKQLDTLRDIIINESGKILNEIKMLDNIEVYGDHYIIKVKKVKTKRLDTEKVKEFLKKMRKLNEFLTESEYYRVEVKRTAVRR